MKLVQTLGPVSTCSDGSGPAKFPEEFHSSFRERARHEQTCFQYSKGMVGRSTRFWTYSVDQRDLARADRWQPQNNPDNSLVNSCYGRSSVDYLAILRWQMEPGEHRRNSASSHARKVCSKKDSCLGVSRGNIFNCCSHGFLDHSI